MFVAAVSAISVTADSHTLSHEQVSIAEALRLTLNLSKRSHDRRRRTCFHANRKQVEFHSTRPRSFVVTLIAEHFSNGRFCKRSLRRCQRRDRPPFRKLKRGVWPRLLAVRDVATSMNIHHALTQE